MDITTWSIAIACIAVILSVLIFVRDNHRYRIPLQIRIPSFVVAWNKGNQSLVLFRLVFVNQAQSGRTILRVLLTPPTDITESQVVWVHDEDYKNVNALLPNSEKSNPLPIHEVLHDALDIPPHQSQSKWVGFLLQSTLSLEGSLGAEFLPYLFAAQDVKGKLLAILEVPIPLNQLMNVGAYSTVGNVVFESYRVRESSNY